jgi:DNA-binding CsgD family transcriptional regulator
MSDTNELSRLIGDIYDAALDPSHWSHALEATCSFVCGASATLMSQDTATKSAAFHFQWGNDETYLKLYQEVYVKLNPVLVPTLLFSRVGSVLSTVDLIPFEEFHASRFYKEWVAPQGYVDSVFATLDKSATGYAFIAVTRHQRHGLVDAETRQRLGLIAPHFQRAVAIGKLFDVHKAEAAMLADAVDSLSTAVFLLREDGQLVHANASGKAVLEDAKLLRLMNGRIIAVDISARKSLREILASAARGDTALSHRGTALPLTTSDGKRYIAHVLSLASGARQQTGILYGAVASMFVHQTALEQPNLVETVGEHFKLTPSELRVLFAVLEVGGAPQVARVLGISTETVRTHLKRLFEKTGTRSQVDLVKLIAQFANSIVL